MISLLKRLASKSKREQKHAVLVLKGGALIAYAFNNERHHAEDRALKLVKGKKKRLTVISVRTNKNGDFLIARPCFKCMVLLQSSGVRRVIYTERDGTFREELL